MTENQPITAEELVELRRLHEKRLNGPCFCGCGQPVHHALVYEAVQKLPRLLDEIERLRAVIRRTHTTHCTDWPTHSPWCLLYELEP